MHITIQYGLLAVLAVYERQADDVMTFCVCLNIINIEPHEEFYELGH
jgi:hypothetical protein